MRRPALVFASALLSATVGLGVAAAETPTGSFPLDTPVTDTPKFGYRRDVVVVDPPPNDVAPALISQVIYLNRCVGGCTLKSGSDDDATTDTSALIEGAPSRTLSEFVHGDQTWNDLMTCMREIYSPYDVQITDQRPAAGTQYHMAIVAGTSQEAGKDPMILGQAIVRGDCAPRNNAVSLSFANSHRTGSSLVYDLCHTVGQESAHAFGLDHSYAFSDGRSSCNDPMTYRDDCGGQRFFRNDSATCGEFSPRPCNCGSQQNSHAKILTVFGPNTGTPLVGPPTVQVTTPTAGGALGPLVAAAAGSKRGVARVELFLNGFKWGEAKGAQFGVNGQPNPSTYSLMVPGNVPNSVIDVVARACDDLGNCTDSAPVTVTKGAPCTSADMCAPGQKCEAGKCFWDEPSGELGDPCTYPQFCKSLRCEGPADAQVCSQACVPGTSDSCPMDMRCLETGPGTGICYLDSDEGGGCCSVGGDDSPAPWAIHGGAAVLLLGLLLRRRRR